VHDETGKKGEKLAISTETILRVALLAGFGPLRC
jgi:hypothetical protein